MTRVVVDASTALAWCFPGETSEYADRVLVSLEGKTILVPPIWGLEISHAILVGERTKRLNQSDMRQFAKLLEGLSLVQDMQAVGRYMETVLPLARHHGLSAYDAAYLELSLRQSAPLATLDAKLRKAAKQMGAEVFLPK